MPHQTESSQAQVEAHHQAGTMRDTSPSPTSTAATLATYPATSSSASNPPTREEIRPRDKFLLRRWYKAFKHYASLQTLRTESPSRHGGFTTVRSSVEASNPASTPPSSLSPTTTGDSAPEIKVVPTIIVTAVNEAMEDTLPNTTISSTTPSANANANATLSPTAASPASAAAAPKQRRRRRRHQPTMLTPEFMREIEEANKKHYDIVVRDEDKRVTCKIFSEPVVSPRATMVRANPLRWGQD